MDAVMVHSIYYTREEERKWILFISRKGGNQKKNYQSPITLGSEMSCTYTHATMTTTCISKSNQFLETYRRPPAPPAAHHPPFYELSRKVVVWINQERTLLLLCYAFLLYEDNNRNENLIVEFRQLHFFRYHSICYITGDYQLEPRGFALYKDHNLFRQGEIDYSPIISGHNKLHGL